MDRAPAFAGAFYPAEPERLAATLDRLVPRREPRERALGVVVPHAGYVYSGGVAGAVYGRIDVPERVVILAPNHTGRGARGALWARGRWRLPGGAASIDEDLAAALLARASLLRDDRLAHAREHAVEVQVPFLAHERADVRIVPVVLGDLPFDACAALGEALADAIEEVGAPVLVVASSDMTHYESARSARAKDERAIARILALDAEGLHRTVEGERISMCGYIPATTMLVAARRLGATEAALVRYAHSGEVTGDLDEVVAYAGIVVR